jgi:hypothetical protein
MGQGFITSSGTIPGFVPSPEPSTLVLATLGLLPLALGAVRRRANARIATA